MAKKTSFFEDVFDIASSLPWWLSIALAIIAFFGCHRLASEPITAPQLSGHLTGTQIGNAIGQQGAGAIVKGIASIFQFVLPIPLLGGAIARLWRSSRDKELLTTVDKRGSVNALFEMSWQEFERLVGEYFRRQGFTVKETGGGGPDGGVDLVLKRGDETTLVQCKKWRAMKVGVETVRELYGVMSAKGAAGGVVVTAGTFTEDAKLFAVGRNIELVDGPQLTELISQVAPGTNRSDRPASQRESAQSLPMCPKCGEPMVRRQARKGPNAGRDFWGCSGYPACRGTRDI